MKKLFFCLASVVLVFIACNKNQKPSQPDIEAPTSDFVNVNLEHFVFDKTDNDNGVSVHVFMEIPKAENDVTTKIRKQVLAFIDNKGSSPKECFNNYVKANISEFGMSSEDLAEMRESFGSEMRSEVSDSISVNMVNQHFLQYCNNSYFYGAGAAHGMYGCGYYIFDLNTGKRLTEKDIFTNISKIEKLLKTEGLNGFLKENELSEEDGVIEKNSITANGNFGVTTDKLIYQYNPYEIACYATGAPTFYLDKESVKPYMKKNTAIYKYWFGEE